jgi:hypothetical protein
MPCQGEVHRGPIVRRDSCNFSKEFRFSKQGPIGIRSGGSARAMRLGF